MEEVIVEITKALFQATVETAAATVVETAAQGAFDALCRSEMQQDETIVSKHQQHQQIVDKVNQCGGAAVIVRNDADHVTVDQALRLLLDGALSKTDDYGSRIGPAWASCLYPGFNPNARLKSKKFQLRISNENVDYNGLSTVAFSRDFSLIRACQDGMHCHNYTFQHSAVDTMQFHTNGEMRSYSRTTFSSELDTENFLNVDKLIVILTMNHVGNLNRYRLRLSKPCMKEIKYAHAGLSEWSSSKKWKATIRSPTTAGILLKYLCLPVQNHVTITAKEENGIWNDTFPNLTSVIANDMRNGVSGVDRFQRAVAD